MAVFPQIAQPVYPFKNKLEDPSLQSKAENGFVISRAKFTRVRETFTLQWKGLRTADYAALRNFWNNTIMGGSNSFTWTYPAISGDPYAGREFEVRVIDGDKEFEHDGPNTWTGTLIIQEV